VTTQLQLINIFFFSSTVVLTPHGKFWVLPLLHSMGDMKQKIRFAVQIKLRPFVLLELICSLLRLAQFLAFGGY
jgi:hypothetical protein